jgi:hypothetical protein
MAKGLVKGFSAGGPAAHAGAVNSKAATPLIYFLNDLVKNIFSGFNYCKGIWLISFIFFLSARNTHVNITAKNRKKILSDINP